MKKLLPIVGVIVAVVALGTLGVWMFRAPTPEQTVREESAAPAGVKPRYSSRVEERLQMLREDYADRQEQDAENARQEAPVAPTAAAAAPPPAAEATPEGAMFDRGKPAAWRPLAPPAPTAQPPVAQVPGAKPHVPMFFPHPEYMDKKLSLGELEDTLVNSPDPEKRRQALEQLSGEEDRDAVRLLTLAMQDPDADLRAQVIESLGDYPDELSADMLAPALKDGDPEVRFEAVSLLAGMNTKAAADALHAALSDPNEDVRSLAQGILDFGKSPPLPSRKKHG